MNRSIRLILSMTAFGGLAGFVYGCSGAAGDPKNDPLPENTGAIVAKLTNVPSDVLCVEIDTSDYRTSQVRADVTPGGSAEIRVAPLDPGSLWLSGVAYNVPCYEVGWYGTDGGASSQVSWVADSTYLQIVSGQTTHADLHFHQLGAADVTVDFDSCNDADASFYYCGQDGGPPVVDAGPIEYDAGFAPKR